MSNPDQIASPITLVYVGAGVVVAGIVGIVLVPAQTPAIVGLASLLALQVVKMLQDARNTAAAAERVEDVKTTLRRESIKTDNRLDSLAHQVEVAQQTGEKIHTLVNSNMSAQLKIAAVALRRISDMRPDDAADAEAANIAEDLYREHEAKQAIVDAKKK